MKEKMLEFIEENINNLRLTEGLIETSYEVDLKISGAIAAFKNMKEFIQTIQDDSK